MIERGDGAGLTLEPLAELRPGRGLSQNDLYRDNTIEARVARLIHLAHAAFAQLGHDDVGTELLAYHGGDSIPLRRRDCQARVTSDIDQFVLRDFTLDLCDALPIPAVITPRSLDLVHLRTALWFHAQAPLSKFVTLDASQAQAGRELGLPT